MKVAVNLTVEVDPEKWDNGELAGYPTQIRDDVRRYLLTHARGAAMIEEAGATIEIRRNK